MRAPKGDLAAAGTRLGASRDGGDRQEMGSPGVLVPPGAPGEVQKDTLLPFKSKSVKWPSSVTPKLLPGSAQHA